jgi:PilZ domain
MIVSQDFQEVSVFECILGGLHMDVEVEVEPQRAWTRLAKSKVDALIVDCDLDGTHLFLRQVQETVGEPSAPVVIVSGSRADYGIDATPVNFVMKKPTSVEQAVHTLSAARNLILKGRLRYHRQVLDAPVSLTSPKRQLKGNLLNLSLGGMRVHLRHPVRMDDTVETNFCLPGTNLALQARGEVAWIDRKGNAGIRFLEISEPMKRDLQLWLEQQYFQTVQMI